MTGGAGGLQGALSVPTGSGVSEVAVKKLDIQGGRANDFATATRAYLAVSSCVGITVRAANYDAWNTIIMSPLGLESQ